MKNKKAVGSHTQVRVLLSTVFLGLQQFLEGRRNDPSLLLYTKQLLYIIGENIQNRIACCRQYSILHLNYIGNLSNICSLLYYKYFIYDTTIITDNTL